MERIRSYFIQSFFLLLLLINIAEAQITNKNVFGTIVDSTSNLPLPNLTITLIDSEDSVILKTSSDLNGKFDIPLQKSNTKVVQIEGVNYHTKRRFLNQEDKGLNIWLGTIKMSPIQNNIEEVKIIGKKPLVSQSNGKLIYNLDADPYSKSSNLLEIMRKVPLLSVDGNENIQLNGSGNYRIFIDGKPSGLIESNPKNILRSIPSSTINSIEIITNPPAKFDAEGLAGVINIVTKRQNLNGYQGSLNIGYRKPLGGPTIGSNLAIKYGKFGFTVISGINRYEDPISYSSLTRESILAKGSKLNQMGHKSSHNKTGYAGIDINFSPDSLNLFSSQFSWNANNNSAISSLFSVEVDSLTVLQDYRMQNNRYSTIKNLEASLNYQRSFKNDKSKLLTLSYRFLNNKGILSSNSNIITEGLKENINLDQENLESLTENSFQIDYVQTFGIVNGNLGSKIILRSNNSNFQISETQPESNQPIGSNSHLSIFNNEQKVVSFYNSYESNYKSWYFRAGLRLENTLIDFDNSKILETTRQSYWNFVPNLAVTLKLNDFNSISLDFNRRVQRPAIYQMNPFVERISLNTEKSGNPTLRPISRDLYQISYLMNKKIVFNIGVGFMAFDNVISEFTTFDSERNVSVTSFENFTSGRVLKSNIYLSYQVNKSLGMTLNADLRRVVFNVKDNLIKNKNEGNMAYVNVSANYRLNPGWRFIADLTVNTGGVSGAQTRTNGFVGNNLTLTKEFFNGNMDISFTAENLFSKKRIIRENIFSNDFLQSTTNQVFYRNFGITLNYRIGKLNKTIDKNKKGIVNDDLQ
ncbi:outer membrane beta-barrel protein [Sphingobacterium endophyticum]|uniref:outer membrane beta-barrel protein n=1 Tax=Sphingobacterium endophyticum TaxID=2546448 RepID=UPI0012E19FB0|nr:outer membrane beta-barrel protein [Sphingobacterium endophyticum]